VCNADLAPNATARVASLEMRSVGEREKPRRTINYKNS